MEHLRALSLRASDMVQEASSTFEEHFLWLEEVLAEARRTLASEDLVLLPKTPSAAPKRTRRVLKEDAENSPPVDFSSPPPSRRGRLCSKLATQKIQEQTRMNRVRKLRRPSSPVSEVPPTTGRRNTRRQACPSPSPTRSDEELSQSPVPKTVQVTTPSSSKARRSVRLVLEPIDSTTTTTITPPKATSTDPGTPQKDKEESPKQSEPLAPQQKDVEMVDVSHKDQRPPKGSSPQKPSSPVKEGACSLETGLVREVSSSPEDVRPQGKEHQHQAPKKASLQGKASPLSPDLHNLSKKQKYSEKEDTVDHSQTSTEATVVPKSTPQVEESLHLEVDDSYGDIMDLETSKGKKDKEEEEMEVVWEAGRKKTEPAKESVPPLLSSSESTEDVTDSKKAPATRVTRTKQRALEGQDAPPVNPQPPSAPAPRVRRTKQKARPQEPEDVQPTDTLPQPASPAPAPRVTRTKQKAAVQDIPPTDTLPSTTPPPPRAAEEVSTQKPPAASEGVTQPPSAPAPRMTRTKQRALEVQEVPVSVPQPAARVTRTKQKAKEEQLNRNTSSEDEGKTSKDVHEGDKGVKSGSVKDSGVYSLGVRTEGWSSAESVSSGGSGAPPPLKSSPPRRVTRSKMNKLQQAQHSPKLPGSPNFQRACCSPRGVGLPRSPHKDSPTARRLAANSGREVVEQLTSEVSHSPVRVVRHSPDKTGKMLEARLQMSGSAGRITPSIVARLQPLLTASSSSSSSSEHGRFIKRALGTPTESRRPVNIVTGITSFIKSQPARPTKEEVEEQRQRELLRKKEREEDTIKKKQQLLKAKAEEQKRRNDERMRRVQERQAADAKERQELERQKRRQEERQREEEQQRIRQLAKKKAEEEARRAARLKEQQEERKRLEEERKAKLEEEKRRQILEEEEEKIRYYAAKRKMEEQMKMKVPLVHILKKKYEAEQAKAKEAMAVPKESEQQAQRQQEAKNVMSTQQESGALNTTYTSSTKNSGGTLNTTYTKPVAESKVNSYEMTPQQPKRTSSSLNDYNIDDMQSDDSTDDENSPKKKIPQWAMKTQIRAAVLQQEYYPPQLEEIFPPRALLLLPDLTHIFPKQKRRFRKRTSSAQWGTPPSKVFRVSSSHT